MRNLDYNARQDIIDQAFGRTNLSTEDILNLVLASRLNACSENTLAGIVGMLRR